MFFVHDFSGTILSEEKCVCAKNFFRDEGGPEVIGEESLLSKSSHICSSSWFVRCRCSQKFWAFTVMC